MPENPTPAAKTEPTEAPSEFNFSNAEAEAPRIRRRSLKAKQAGLIKPPGAVPPTARELEREAPPLSAEQAEKAVTRPAATTPTPVSRVEPAAKPAEPSAAPPRTTPLVSPAATAPKTTVAASTVNGATPATTVTAPPKTTIASSSTATNSTTSPHGTRPATLYYSSYPRKEKEAAPAAQAPMKTIPTASTASTSTVKATTQPAATTTTRPASTTPAATTVPTSVTRPAASASASRPSITSDYRANVERQSREQKSVGSILSYVVYGLIAFFVLAAALAGYGGYVLSQRISDQSVTVNQLDTKYASANKELIAKLATTQDTLNQAQAQITRENDLIVKQQDELNRLIAAINDNTKSLAVEKQARIQEAINLRARIRDLENDKTAPATR
jgi:hypothetical protein